jgi:hypothetical protein
LLTFVIPVRHQATVEDWPGVKQRMEVTLRSLCAQRHPGWNAVVVANEGADLPEIPDRVDVAWVDFPRNTLPNRAGPIEEFYQAVRLDKGRRLLAGLALARPKGHVMFVDYDDIVSCRLAELVSRHPSSNGWFFQSGFLWSGGLDLLLCEPYFFKYCGTSHIVRSDLLPIPDVIEDANEQLVCRWLGSHIFIKDDFDKIGTSLNPLPFAGTIYRVGHCDATSGSSNLAAHLTLLGQRTSEEEVARKLRSLDDSLTQEFFGQPVP